MWFPSTDKRISRDRPEWDGKPLQLPEAKVWRYKRTLEVPEAAVDLILDEHVKRQQGQGDALDGHALFVREKFAFALAVLDGRGFLNDEDWELSGIAMKVSDATREWVAAAKDQAARDDAADRGMLLGVSHQAAEEEKTHRHIHRVNRVAGWVLCKLKDNPRGLTGGALNKLAPSRDRSMVSTAIKFLAEQDPPKIKLSGKVWTRA
jgi:hypothetical protein